MEHEGSYKLMLDVLGRKLLNMNELILGQLGATPEQIDRERERIRTELFRGPMDMKPIITV